MDSYGHRFDSINGRDTKAHKKKSSNHSSYYEDGERKHKFVSTAQSFYLSRWQEENVCMFPIICVLQSYKDGFYNVVGRVLACVEIQWFVHRDDLGCLLTLWSKERLKLAVGLQ